MFFIVHNNLVKHTSIIVDNTKIYANTNKLLMDYVSEKCNATIIEEDDEVDKIDRYFKINEDKNKVCIYKSVDAGYIYNNFLLELIEEVDVVKYDLKNKSYLEVAKEDMVRDIKNLGGCLPSEVKPFDPQMPQYSEADF